MINGIVNVNKLQVLSFCDLYKALERQSLEAARSLTKYHFGGVLHKNPFLYSAARMKTYNSTDSCVFDGLMATVQSLLKVIISHRQVKS